jgi:hypothetical protein
MTMGEKYSPEKLEAMRSVGFNKSGRITHNEAGVPQRVVNDTREEKTIVDENNAIYKYNSDGTQDLTLNPKPVHVSMSSAPIG